MTSRPSSWVTPAPATRPSSRPPRQLGHRLDHRGAALGAIRGRRSPRRRARRRRSRVCAGRLEPAPRGRADAPGRSRSHTRPLTCARRSRRRGGRPPRRVRRSRSSARPGRARAPCPSAAERVVDGVGVAREHAAVGQRLHDERRHRDAGQVRGALALRRLEAPHRQPRPQACWWRRCRTGRSWPTSGRPRSSRRSRSDGSRVRSAKRRSAHTRWTLNSRSQAPAASSRSSSARTQPVMRSLRARWAAR